MLKPLTRILVDGEILQIIFVEPTAPEGRVYYAVDESGLGVWLTEKEIDIIF